MISPVMAVSDLTQRPEYREKRATAMATPAEGPSLPMAPAGKCMWRSVSFGRSHCTPYYCEGVSAWGGGRGEGELSYFWQE